MKNSDFFELNEGQLMAAINSAKQKPQRLSALKAEAMRMVLSLDNLLISFPNSSNDQRIELKLVVLKLKKMIEEIENIQLKNTNDEKFRLTNSRYML